MRQGVQEGAARGMAVEAQVPRRAALMFDLSIQLARLLEFLAARLPAAFNRGSTLNLTRLIELLSFILSHTAGPGASPPATLPAHPADPARFSYVALLQRLAAWQLPC